MITLQGTFFFFLSFSHSFLLFKWTVYCQHWTEANDDAWAIPIQPQANLIITQPLSWWQGRWSDVTSSDWSSQFSTQIKMSKGFPLSCLIFKGVRLRQNPLEIRLILLNWNSEFFVSFNFKNLFSLHLLLLFFFFKFYLIWNLYFSFSLFLMNLRSHHYIKHFNFPGLNITNKTLNSMITFVYNNNKNVNNCNKHLLLWFIL